DWLKAREACKQLHPGYEFKFWDDRAAEEFIIAEHRDFYETWKSYRYPIQRADSLRYLILYSYGGIYMDMDLVCLRPLEPFRRFDFIAPAAHPIGVSNGFIMISPRHPFMKQVVDNLSLFNRFFISAYPTVMFSTGCTYLSAQHLVSPHRNQLKVLSGLNNKLSGNSTTPLFHHLGASSWHSSDAPVFNALGRFLKSVPIF
ncbi:nucleotide-diphospho-sugar transferase, partial [Blyttiomyces helicus]